jgi:TonB family protein
MRTLRVGTLLLGTLLVGLLLVGTGLPVCLVALAAAQQAPVRVGGNIPPPAKLRDVRPAYPPIAQSARVTGVVVMEALVDENGNVAQARVLRGVPLLNDAALDAVKQWQYQPTFLNGVAVPVIMTVTVSFNLQNGGGPLPGPPPPYDPPLPPAGTPAPPMGEAFVVEPGRAGLVIVGMTADALFRRIPRDQARLIDLQTGGSFVPALQIATGPGELSGLVALLAAEWRIGQIEVRDPRFRTRDGLGVGSTLAELRARDPNLQLEQSPFGAIAPMAGKRVVFSLEAAATGVDPAQLPDSTPVLRLFVTDGAMLRAHTLSMSRSR